VDAGRKLEYILELADNVDYEDAVEYKVGMVSEFTVGGLCQTTGIMQDCIPMTP